nr:MAG TPA_asm: hypothetical protein [Caudoviricetes sp.]
MRGCPAVRLSNNFDSFSPFRQQGGDTESGDAAAQHRPAALAARHRRREIQD